MLRQQRWIIAALFALVFAGLSFLMYLLISMRAQPPLPPLLRNVSAAGGYTGGCPSQSPEGAEQPLALSPELNRRLADEFPRGSDGDRIEEALLGQRFHMLAPCERDQSIHAALFQQAGGGLFGPFPIHATIYWKLDDQNRILWTKGFVEYTGP